MIAGSAFSFDYLSDKIKFSFRSNEEQLEIL